MRIWHFLLFGFAFFIGGIFAFRQQNQFPPRVPEQFRVVPNTGPKPFACGTIAPPYMNYETDSLAALGKILFRNNCATCHNKNMKDDLTDPALADATERWEEYPKEDLYKWIRNAQQMINEKHPKALELWGKWKPTIMNDFSELTDEEIESILHYIALIYS